MPAIKSVMGASWKRRRIVARIFSLLSPEGTIDISQAQASLRAPRLDKRAKRFTPCQGDGKHARKMTHPLASAQIHRPIWGECGFHAGTGGYARRLAGPRLRSYVPSGHKNVRTPAQTFSLKREAALRGSFNQIATKLRTKCEENCNQPQNCCWASLAGAKSTGKHGLQPHGRMPGFMARRLHKGYSIGTPANREWMFPSEPGFRPAAYI